MLAFNLQHSLRHYSKLTAQSDQIIFVLCDRDYRFRLDSLMLSVMLLNPALLNQLAHILVYFVDGKIDLNLIFIKLFGSQTGGNVYSGNNAYQYLQELTPFDLQSWLQARKSRFSLD
ncbi:hypothetical protein M595_2261 [Lyngbya aestuarii BL J]|uniref:Uncharacterized protein n=2 Tax=Lyngbya aestuarii TaxID=118322 RepID=U7QKT8_9CYAN|nr:hypothetical protein M595_2261 [Lyngbya aestuarii BL J]